GRVDPPERVERRLGRHRDRVLVVPGDRALAFEDARAPGARHLVPAQAVAGNVAAEAADSDHKSPHGGRGYARRVAYRGNVPTKKQPKCSRTRDRRAMNVRA